MHTLMHALIVLATTGPRGRAKTASGLWTLSLGSGNIR